MTFIKARTKNKVWEEKLPKVNFFSAKLFPKVVVGTTNPAGSTV